jgi:serine/threonine-protein kinase
VIWRLLEPFVFFVPYVRRKQQNGADPSGFRHHRDVRICPACSREYGDDLDVCKDDGVALVHLDTSAAQDAQDLIGQVVDGRYRVERIVGRGGMGTVYACRHVVVGKAFAMKVLRTGIERNEEILQRFIREAQAANAVKSRHICEMSDFGQLQNGAFYVVMELLEGMSLTRALREQRLTRRDVKHVFIQIAETLQRAHDQQIIHRDLKPDNVVLVTDDGDPFFVKLVDFGIAKVMQSKASNLTETGVILGTPYYMSPEQARGDPIDHRSDIYALGVMMYRAFTGKLPFVADTAMGVLTRHLTEKPQLPSLIADMDNATERLILRCLEKLPIDRFQSMTDVGEALRSIPDELWPRSSQETMDERSQRYAQHHATQATPTRVATPAAKIAAAGGPSSQRTDAAQYPVSSPMPHIPPPVPAPFGAGIAPMDAREPVVSIATPTGATPSGFAANAPGYYSTPPPGSLHPPGLPAPTPHPSGGFTPSGYSSGPYSVPSGAIVSSQPGHTAGSSGPYPTGATGVHPGYHQMPDGLPPHLQGEAATNRGVVSSRMAARTQPGKRTGVWLLVAALALGAGALGAIVMRGRMADGSSTAPASSGREIPAQPSNEARADQAASAPSPSSSTTASVPDPSASTAASAPPRNGPPVSGSSLVPGPGVPPPPSSGRDDIRSPFD